MKNISSPAVDDQNLEPLAELLAKTETEPQSWFVQTRELTKRFLNNINCERLFAPCLICGDRILGYLERYFPCFRPQTLTFELNHKIFGKVDQREHFLPVRFQTIVDRIAADGKTTEESEKWRRLARWCAKRYRVEFFRDTTSLNNAFAIFDPDSEAQYEPEIPLEEKQAFCDKFFVDVLKILKDCNFVELPRNEITRLINLRRPASLTIKADYDGFEEYRVFVRGVVKTDPFVYPRRKSLGRVVTVESEILSRVCVVTRKKIFAADGSEQESIVVLKLFKHLLLEDLKQVLPNTHLKLPLSDALKLAGVGAAILTAAVVKFCLFATSFVAGFFTLATTMVAQTIKSALGFINCRTKYQRRHLSSLYSQTLASNRAAISLLVALAEDQEVKEIVLGYFAASQFDDWATEKEIDDVAEAWLAERFKLDVDFESDDAIRKLLEKRLVERCEKDGEVLYRAVPLDEALSRLENDWNSLCASAASVA